MYIRPSFKKTNRMATLERIRKNSGLLIIVIGLAMLAFILTDLFSSGNSFLRGNANVVGIINGDKIEMRQFSSMMEQARTNYRNNAGAANMANMSDKQFADQVWNRILRDRLYEDILGPNGLSLSSDELYQRIINNENIKNNESFRDPNTGQFSEAAFKQALNGVRENMMDDPQLQDMWNAWVEFEDAMKEQGKMDKFHKLAQQAIYYPEPLARQLLSRQSQNFRARFVALRYDEIPDSTVEVTESEMRAHIQNNPNQYKREAERDILFVNFKVEPSEEDKQQLIDELEELKNDRYVESDLDGTIDTIPGFENTEEDSLFVSTYSEIRWDNTYFKRDRLLPELDSAIWDAPEGYVHGPYLDGNYWQLVKLIDRIQLPDSVRARHVLLAYQGAERAPENLQRSPVEAKAIADSVLAYIREDRSRFEEVSDSLSDDAVAQSKGGDLGWFGQNAMVKPFADFCFYNEEGKLGMVFSNFGIHIVEIMEHSEGETAIRVARVSRQLIPSEATRDDIYNKASIFATSVTAENFGEKAEEAGFSPRPFTGLQEFDENITGLGKNRAVVRWSFETKREEGDIQLFTNDPEQYTVVLLEAIKPEGLPEVDEVEAIVRPKVVKEKKKEQLLERMREAFADVSTVEEGAANLGMDASKIMDQRLSFMQVNVTGVGGEPGFVAMMSGSELNELFPPYGGDRAVFAGMVVERDAAVTEGDVTSLITQNQDPMRTRLPNALFLALKEEARVKDMRSKFY